MRNKNTKSHGHKNVNSENRHVLGNEKKEWVRGDKGQFRQQSKFKSKKFEKNKIWQMQKLIRKERKNDRNLRKFRHVSPGFAKKNQKL